MNVSDAILGQAPIHAVEECPQQATHHSHHDKKGQVHCCPQVAVLISIWTLTSMEFCNSITLKHNKNNKINNNSNNDNDGGTIT